MVEDPKDYRWSGYGAAMAGRRGAKEGLGKVVAGLQQGVESLSGSLAAYRMFLYLEGSEEREAVDENALTRPPGTLSQGERETLTRPPGTLSRGERGTVRGALRREEVLKVLKAKGKLPLGSYLRCRVRYFCDGAVFGSKEFVEGMFRECRGWFGEVPDYRNVDRQHYCGQPACRQASKSASQRRWSHKTENHDYFRDQRHVERVQEWRRAHPGYWRKQKPQSEETQTVEPQPVNPEQ